MSNSLIVSINTELSVLIECIALIYFSNSVMQYRNSRTKSNLLIIIGYAIYGVICAFYVPVLNILGFIIINFIVLYWGFSDSAKTIALRVIILTAIMMFWELVFSLLTDTKIEQRTYGNINPVLDAIMAIFSKTMYFISLVMLKRFAPGRSGKSTPEMYGSFRCRYAAACFSCCSIRCSRRLITARRLYLSFSALCLSRRILPCILFVTELLKETRGYNICRRLSIKTRLIFRNIIF